MLAELTYPVALPVAEEQTSSPLLPMEQNQQVTTLNSSSHTNSHLALLAGCKEAELYRMHGGGIAMTSAQTRSLAEDM